MCVSFAILNDGNVNLCYFSSASAFPSFKRSVVPGTSKFRGKFIHAPASSLMSDASEDFLDARDDLRDEQRLGVLESRLCTCVVIGFVSTF